MLASMKLYSYFFFVIFLFECRAKNYCGSNICNNSKQHTLCKFQSQDPARHCIDYENTIKSSEDKQAILDKLNSRRNKVAAGDIRSLPSAENMMKLEWNEELELFAQRWANQCVKHYTPDLKDTCRDLGSVYAEQNIATIFGESPGLTPLALVDVWYMELLNVNATVIPKYRRSKDAGFSHYEYFTQLVWAKSRQVGCGAVKFKERLHNSENEKNRVVYRLVCNFAPGGNIVNQTVYNDGQPCSNCPTGSCDSVYTALCKDEEILRTRSTKPVRIEHVSKSTVTKKDTKSTRVSSSSTSQIANTAQDDDEFLPPFDFLPHTRGYNRPTLETGTKTTTKCKDVLGVDDFVELLKEKLSTDPMFKDILQTSVKTKESVDNGFTHALALISKLYTKNSIYPTTRIPSTYPEYLNSTLLVDLVEAVIFRNADKPRTEDPNIGTLNFEVNPIRIQPEMGKVIPNPDVTGNLFFPEELGVEDVDESSETAMEQYYDVTRFSQADSKIESLRRSKATKDFVDEILESETVTERPEIYNNMVIKKRELKDMKVVKSGLQSDSVYNSIQNVYNNIGLKVPEAHKKIASVQYQNYEIGGGSLGGSYVVKYVDLIKKLASDLKVLRLNEKFHCSNDTCLAKSTFHIFLLAFVGIINIFLL